MRRWNGWGEESITHPLPAAARRYLLEALGASIEPADIALDHALKCVPAPRLPEKNGLYSTSASDRLLHARGQSLPDWIALRSGLVGRYPDAVAFPTAEDQVHALLAFAAETGTALIPYGGGTSVVGHVNPPAEEEHEKRPVLTVDMGRFNRLIRFDPVSLLATFGCGVLGPNLEAELRARGCTLGHFPQSFEFSTLGGWVATRSSGQESLRYGRIEELFAGGRVETPRGTLDLQPFPASAAGPDLRHLILGSEGRLGILTQATVRAVPIPEREEFHAIFFPDFDRGQTAVRCMVQAGLPLSMLRLSTPEETETALALAGHERLTGLLGRLLSLRGIGDDKCMLVMGVSGREAMVKATRGEANQIASLHKGLAVGKQLGSHWRKTRFRTAYLRNTLWSMGYAVDTVETAAEWSRIDSIRGAVETALRSGLEQQEGEKVHAVSHLSHQYRSGSSIYTTYLFRVARDPEQTLARWQTLKKAASEAISGRHGTISHQHGIGTDHSPYLAAEKGPLGTAVLRGVCRELDPAGIMNPGKLLREG